MRRSDKTKYILAELGVDGRVMWKLILKKSVCKASNWIHLTQNMDKQRDVVNRVMNIAYT